MNDSQRVMRKTRYPSFTQTKFHPQKFHIGQNQPNAALNMAVASVVYHFLIDLSMFPAPKSGTVSGVVGITLLNVAHVSQ